VEAWMYLNLVPSLRDINTLLVSAVSIGGFEKKTKRDSRKVVYGINGAIGCCFQY
jgi:hypothetical protein